MLNNCGSSVRCGDSRYHDSRGNGCAGDNAKTHSPRFQGKKGFISSGYSPNPMNMDYHSSVYAAVIAKPYGFKEPGEALDAAFRKIF